MQSAQIKSKQRVQDHGEVYTNPREVNAMLDLVKHETERIESRFLEPACGNGNFLVEILRRKLNVVDRLYSKHLPDYERYSILALTSIYGVELLEDNAQDCRDRLYDIWEEAYTKQAKSNIDEDIKRTAAYILEKNILCGDALTMLRNDGKPIVFAQWDFVSGDLIKRRDYRLDVLLDSYSSTVTEMNQTTLFDTGEKWEIDKKTGIRLPSPIKEYPLVDYRKLFNYEYFT